LEYGFCNDAWSQNPAAVRTSMTIYRRKATTKASRSTWAMLEIKDLTTPEPPQINSNDLFTVINSMLLPASNTSSATNFSATEVLTEYINILELSLSPYAQMADGATLVLRNLLTIPLYLCNSVALTGTSSISTVQSQLPAENQLFGSNIWRSPVRCRRYGQYTPMPAWPALSY
jgi:hypothetical protein